MKLIARTLLLCVTGLLVWRIVALGISEHYVDRLREGDPGAADKALAWQANQPKAAYRVALARIDQDPDQGVVLLKEAYANNPAEVRPLIALAKLADSQGKPSQAQALLSQATKLNPADSVIRKEVAGYWISKGDLEQAMQHWSHALEAQPTERSTLFPLFLNIAENPETLGFFRSFATSPPTWWEPFFADLARRALHLETVRALYAMRRNAAGTPITPQERKAYMARLQKEGELTEAYLAWVNGLNATERSQLGMINNGSFELEPSNSGFDWHIAQTANVTVETAKTYDVHGNRALHLIFKHREGRFAHVYQPLFLNAATYRLTGKVRTDSLESLGGLQWRIQCTTPSVNTLGNSERFLGSGDWRTFTVEFQVPDTCTAQEIRLVSAGSKAFEHKITGGAWFDAMVLRRIALPTPQP
ncbi:hypothetical protein CCR95_16610 [Thiocystis minor]|uniref:tetratricopeptide repeat protein n=1 Tax=Thiocystis minor TaxID=61597 RepID=UPI001913C895|nr:tetratricopeptide repeat protein [Thiocystis minor]MBK5965660.1 hypothetical protein [Thiocystis minor]